MGRRIASIVLRVVSAPSFDRLVNRIMDCNVGPFFSIFFLWVNFTKFSSILLELFPCIQYMACDISLAKYLSHVHMFMQISIISIAEDKI